MSDLPLITKYRPDSFSQVLGHDVAIGALQRVLKSPSRPHAFLFSGPSGLGKTTLARIVGHYLEADINEIDAASNSGVDAMRQVVELSQYMSMTGAGIRLLLVDECHRLSRPAFDAILKLLEEPPTHLFLALCTTELVRLPPTIIGRCYHVQLNPLKPTEIEDLLTAICDLEEWTVRPDIFQMVVQACQGSPRNALSLMQKVHDLPTREEAKRVLALIEAGDPLIDLLQHLIAGKSSWKVMRAIIERIEPDAWEDTALIAGRYIMGAMINAEEDKAAARIWQLLDALVFPANTYDKKATFLAAIGRMIWGGS